MNLNNLDEHNTLKRKLNPINDMLAFIKFDTSQIGSTYTFDIKT